MSAKISIIMPVFNREYFVAKAIESILMQSYTNWELIVVDDGSTDSTEQVIIEYKNKIKQVLKYIKLGENQGVGFARNVGIEHSIGEYVAFLDSDDQWKPYHLKSCLEVLQCQNKIDCIFGNFEYKSEENGEIFISDGLGYSIKKKNIELKTSKINHINILDKNNLLINTIRNEHLAPLGASVFRKKLFEKVKFQPVRIHEDTVFWVECLLYGAQFAFLNRVHYTIHDHSQRTVIRKLKSEEEISKVIRAHIDSYASWRYLKSQSHLFTKEGQKSLNLKLKNLCFWIIGYRGFAQINDFKALYWYHLGLKYAPFDFACWKTYFSTLVKLVIGKLIKINRSRSTG